MKVKVCGITQKEQLLQLDRLNVDYAGLIFYKPSKRSMQEKLRPEDVNVPGLGIQKSGVFVNATADEILRAVDAYKLDLVQLHGDETVALCNQVSDYVKVVKAFRLGSEVKDIDRMVSPYFDSCDYYLFDNASMGVFGGTGEKFNWKSFENAQIHKPFFLSGGITPEDAALISGFNHPHFYAIDINSRFETEPGVKDMKLVENFLKAIPHDRKQDQ